MALPFSETFALPYTAKYAPRRNQTRDRTYGVAVYSVRSLYKTVRNVTKS